ncbi:MAG: hypothetical protein RLP44_31540 [Aggregatilineales bacterium]
MAKKNTMRKGKTLRLRDDHTWKAPSGYKIVVMDAGAASFNIPVSWVLTKMEPLEVLDKEPPDDDARITVTLWRFPPGIDWSGLPLEDLLENATNDPALKERKERTEIKRVPRKDIEMVWKRDRWIDDENDNREAYTNIAYARGYEAHVLITFDYWVDDAKKFKKVWDEVVRSLILDRKIQDPTKGERLQ